jgi:ABC-type lipoprotein release transport system permease subunit
VWHTVVGIAADVRNVGLARPAEPEYYLLRKYAPDPVFGDGSAWRSAAVVVRSPLAARAVSTELRRAIAELEPTLPVEMQTLRERASEMTEQPRFNALLLGGFAAIGLALAAIGVYGVIAFLVTQRSREIGVRMALGATPRIVARHFVRHAALWTAAGTAIGLAGAWFATEVIGRLLFQVGSRDPWSFVAAPVLLFLVALAAAWIPSRRAAAVDPVRALRQE